MECLFGFNVKLKIKVKLTRSSFVNTCIRQPFDRLSNIFDLNKTKLKYNKLCFKILECRSKYQKI